MVTGPALTRDTSMSAPKRPVTTGTDSVHQQALGHLGDALLPDVDPGPGDPLHDGPHESDFPLVLEATAVDRATLRAHQDELADSNACHDFQGAAQAYPLRQCHAITNNAPRQ